jgi:hypothetical protein
MTDSLPVPTFLQRHNFHDVTFKWIRTWSKEEKKYRWFRVMWETHFTDKVAWSHNFLSVGLDLKKPFCWNVVDFYEKRINLFCVSFHRRKSVSGRFA